MDYYKTRSMALSIIAAVSCRHFQQCFPVLLKIFQQQGDLTLAQAEQLCQAPLGQGICHTAASLFAAAAPVGEPQAQGCAGTGLPIRCAVQKDLERILCRKLICHYPHRQGPGLAGSQPCQIQDRHRQPPAAGTVLPFREQPQSLGQTELQMEILHRLTAAVVDYAAEQYRLPGACQGLVSAAAELQLPVILPGCELLDLCIQKRPQLLKLPQAIGLFS